MEEINNDAEADQFMLEPESILPNFEYMHAKVEEDIGELENDDDTLIDNNHLYEYDEAEMYSALAPEISLIEDGFDYEEDTIPWSPNAEFYIIAKGTNRGKPKLVESIGYSYTIRGLKKAQTKWCCCIRSKILCCNATVTQTGNKFVRTGVHTHPPIPGIGKIIADRVEIKLAAEKDINSSVHEILEELEVSRGTTSVQSYKSFATISKMIHRYRQSIVPSNPAITNFKVDMEYFNSINVDVASFIQSTVASSNQRYMIFATPTQLTHLTEAKAWFIDSSVKLDCPPFRKLLSIHAYLKCGKSIGLYPLVFILMTRYQLSDYTTVFHALRGILPTQPELVRIVADFDRSVWTSIYNEFQEVDLKGCLLHWTKDVFGKIKSLGLEPDYDLRGRTYSFLSRILCLPYLSAKDIECEFEHLCSVANIGPDVKKVLDYVDTKWISHSYWKPVTWSVFGMPIRTIKDVEKWHNRIPGRAGKYQMQFYTLVPLLLKEANLVTGDMSRMTEGSIRRKMVKRRDTLDAQIIRLWRCAYDEDITARQLLVSICDLMASDAMIQTIYSDFLRKHKPKIKKEFICKIENEYEDQDDDQMMMMMM